MIIETECFLYNKRMIEELGIKCEDTLAKVIINTDEVETVRQCCKDDEDEISIDTCMVGFKSGDSMQINMSYERMKKYMGYLP